MHHILATVKWIEGELVGEEGTIAICTDCGSRLPGVTQELSEAVEEEQEIFCVRCRKFLGYINPHGPDPLHVLN